MAKRDFYDVLGVSRDADEKTIKKAYRKIAKKYHPDTNAGDENAERMFKEASEAYDVLGDKEKKRLYDTYGHMALENGFDEQAYKDAMEGRNAYGSFGGFGDFDFSGAGGYGNSFRGFSSGGYGGGMGDIFGDLFGGSFRGASPERSRGADLHSDIEISFEEAVLGCDKVFSFVNDNGAGGPISLKVHIPSGIDEGKSIRLKGKGATGPSENGDLMLKVHVRDSGIYTREGMDIFSTVRIPFITAVMGGQEVVDTVHGRVKCKIAPGTQSGTKIRLRGKGAPDMKHPEKKGDHYVTVQIDVPKNLSSEALRKLEEFDELRRRGKDGSERASAGSAA